jgi:4-aminobutyrate aminotransferase-like enzyme
MADRKSEMLARRDALLGSAYRLFYEDPVHIVRGEGVWLYDSDGRRYLDVYNNVPHVGHCHPRVAEAICAQAKTLNTHTRYLHESILDYAERLTGRLPGALDTAMFCCSGSEANELALRIARAATGGEGIVVTDNAYHGNTKATWEVSTEDIPAEHVPDYVVTVPSPDTYRGRYRDNDAAECYAAHTREALKTLERRGIRPAAFLIDTIISSSGVVAPPPGYLRQVAAIVRDAGALFIADEVQPGFGRTGRNFWGFEADALEPDIVTMGKPMGNGHPLAAVVTRRDLAARFNETGSYFNTFGGNPVSCAAGLAVLDVIEDEKLQENALTVGQYLVNGLGELAQRHQIIGDIRGTGLFLALELVTDRDKRLPATAAANRIVNHLRDNGVLTSSIGPDDNILKLRPPMVMSLTDVDFLIETLDATLAKVA